MSGIVRRKVIALDSNVFIYHFESNPHFTAYTDAIFKKLLEKKLRAITTIISVIEALSYPSSSTVVQQIEEGFKVVPNLTIYEVNREIALQAARIEENTNTVCQMLFSLQQPCMGRPTYLLAMIKGLKSLENFLLFY